MSIISDKIDPVKINKGTDFAEEQMSLCPKFDRLSQLFSQRPSFVPPAFEDTIGEPEAGSNRKTDQGKKDRCYWGKGYFSVS